MFGEKKISRKTFRHNKVQRKKNGTTKERLLLRKFRKEMKYNNPKDNSFSSLIIICFLCCAEDYSYIWIYCLLFRLLNLANEWWNAFGEGVRIFKFNSSFIMRCWYEVNLFLDTHYNAKRKIKSIFCWDNIRFNSTW